MKLFNKVAIVGVGLIGGSIALAIKKKQLANEVIGVSRSRKTLVLAKKNRVVDRSSQDINIIGDADLVILATPVNIMLNLAPVISGIIRPGCIVSDVGSTKQDIVSRLDKIFSCYIGSHPLAGSEKRGITNALPDMFKDSLCILTPTGNTDRKALIKMKVFWNRLGAKVVFLSPATHDNILSFTSHLPHLAAFSLIDSIPTKYSGFASSGLKDTTRIAGSDAHLWADIFLSNRKNMLKAIEVFQGRLARIKSAIQKRDKKLLIRILKLAKKKRDILA